MSSELMIFMRGDADRFKDDKIKEGYEIRQHASGFDGEYYIEEVLREDAEEFEKDVNKHRNERIGQLHSLIKRLDNRRIHITPFCSFENNWDEIFKEDIEVFYKFLCDKEMFDRFLKNWMPTIHYGIWDNVNSYTMDEEENGKQYAGWRFLMMEFEFDVIQRKYHELFSKLHVYHSYNYEREHFIFFFEKFRVIDLINIFDAYLDFSNLDIDIGNKIAKFKEQLLINDNVDAKIEKIIKERFNAVSRI